MLHRATFVQMQCAIVPFICSVADQSFYSLGCTYAALFVLSIPPATEYEDNSTEEMSWFEAVF